MESDTVEHNGGCHCRRVRWRVQAPSSVLAWQCNCSDCSTRGNISFIIPSEKFELLGDSKEFLTTYTYGTHTAKHTFCKVCGITSFYIPRSNSDGVAVTFRLSTIKLIQSDRHCFMLKRCGLKGHSFYNHCPLLPFLKAKYNILAIPSAANRLQTFT